MIHAQRAYLLAILNLYLVSPVRDIGWDEGSMRFTYLIPEVRKGENEVIAKLEQLKYSKVPQNCLEWMRTFIDLEGLGITPLKGSKAQGHLVKCLNECIDVYSNHLSHGYITVVIDGNKIRVPIDRTTRGALSELALYGGAEVNWLLDPSQNNQPGITLTTEQVKQVLVAIIQAWEQPETGLWATINVLRGRVKGKWPQLITLARELLELIETPV